MGSVGLKLEIGTFAALLRVTEKAVRDWIAAGMPVANQGSRGGGKNRDKTLIDLQAAIGWYFRENYERMELERQRSDLAREQARKVALENAERSTVLVRAAPLAKAFADAASSAQAALLSIPTKEAPMLASLTDPNAIEQRLTVAINDALVELSAYRIPDRRSGGDSSGGGTGDGPARPAARPNRKRVGRRAPKTQ